MAGHTSRHRYIKDSNGKYKLADKKQEPIVMVNEQLMGPLTLEEIDKRLRKVELKK
jgi:hypothetical protein